MKQQAALPLVWPERYDPDNYIVADCNAQALQAMREPQKWKTPVLLLIGEAGSGKTHLAHIFQKLHDAASIGSSAAFDAVLAGDEMFVVVDAADSLLKDDPALAEKLFHLVNHVTAKQGRLLLTAKTIPVNWVSLPDLLSRLQIATHLMLEQPSEDMIRAAYQKLFADRSLLVDDKVLGYLTMRSERSFSGIRRIVETLDKAALERSRKITIPLIQSLDLF